MTRVASDAQESWPTRDSLRPPAAPRRAIFVTGASVAIWAATWLVGDRTVGSAVLLALAIGGAGAAAYLAPRQPILAFGIMFLLASLSRVTVELPVGTMRMEHPAIAFVALALLVDRRGRWRLPSGPEATVLILACGYVVVLAASSLVVAPHPLASLRIALWTALSLVGGILAYGLVRTAPLEAERWLRIAGVLLALAGITVGAWYVLRGPSEIPGMSASTMPWRKVAAYAWEPNLYASFLAAMAPFAVDRFRRRLTVRDGAVAAVILVAIGLGVTRGAYLGIVAGFAVYGIVLWRRRAGRRLVPILAFSALATLAGVLLSNIVLATPPTTDAPLPGSPAPSLAPGSPSVPTPPEPTPTPESPDTIQHRLDRVEPALGDFATSPWIGLGADSFGQRHADSSKGGAPDHIAILALALPYEAGIIGALSFSGAVALLLLALTRTSRLAWATGTASAYLAAIVTLLVAYQATSALVFGLNWMLAGVALALAVASHDSAPSREAA